MKKSILAVLAVFLLTCSALAGSKIDLNVKEGDSFEMSSSIHQTITQIAMGMEIEINMDIDLVMSLDVIEVNESDILFSQKYKTLKVVMNSPMQGVDVTMDSNGESNEYNNALKSTIGEEVQVRVNMKGEVIDVTGLEEVMKNLSSTQDTGADVLQFFNEESLEKNYQNLFPVEFGREYSKGDTWSQELSSNEGMEVTTKTTYTADQVSKSKFEFSSVSQMNMSGAQENQGMEMEIEMTGNVEGTGSLNPKTGILSAYDQSGKITGKTTIEASEQMPMDMEIPMTIEMTVKTTVK